MSKRFSLILAVALSLPLSTTAPADAQSYPMTCQLGTMNTAFVDFYHGWTYVYFTGTNGPASSGLQPGQCAWADRAVSASEPHRFCFQGVVLLTIRLSGTTVTETSPGSSSGGALLKQVMYGPTKLMNFSVHSGSGAGYQCLIIDHFGV